MVPAEVLDEKATAKFLVPANAPRLDALATLVKGATPFDHATLEAKIAAWLLAEGLQIKDVAQAARVALTGRTASPGLYEVMEVLGEERTVARLLHGRDLALGS